MLREANQTQEKQSQQQQHTQQTKQQPQQQQKQQQKQKKHQQHTQQGGQQPRIQAQTRPTQPPVLPQKTTPTSLVEIQRQEEDAARADSVADAVAAPSPAKDRARSKTKRSKHVKLELSGAQSAPSPQRGGEGSAPKGANGGGQWTCVSCGTQNWTSTMECRQAACKQSRAEQTRLTRASPSPAQSRGGAAGGAAGGAGDAARQKAVGKVARAAREECIRQGRSVELLVVIARVCTHFNVSSWREVGCGEYYHVEELRAVQRLTQGVWMHMLVYCKDNLFTTPGDLERSVVVHTP